MRLKFLFYSSLSFNALMLFVFSYASIYLLKQAFSFYALAETVMSIKALSSMALSPVDSIEYLSNSGLWGVFSRSLLNYALAWVSLVVSCGLMWISILGMRWFGITLLIK